MATGTLWVVATPIGNLEDLSPRARRVLAEAALVVAEDTRHTGKLLSHFGIRASMWSLHEHNEAQRLPQVIARLQQGDDVALVSDAGTPLIADPGYRLVRAAREAGIAAAPVPGPCALIAALSIAGLPTDRFHFEGFLPAKSAAREKRLETLVRVPVTLVFYESPKRVAAGLADMAAQLGGERGAVLCRELTKIHETVHSGTLAALHAQVAEHPESQRGEYVIVVAGAGEGADPERLSEGKRLFELLRKELPAGKAAKVAAQFTGCRRNALYPQPD